MAILTRKQILAAQDRQPETVAVPEWGGEVQVRGLSGRERGQYELWATSSKINKAGKLIQGDATLDLVAMVRVRLISLCIVDEAGIRLFGDADIEALADKDSAPIERVFDVAARLSGLSSADAQTLTDLPNAPSASGSSD
jgi:hypothetical protein